MSATGNYVGLLNDLDLIAAKSGVNRSRLVAAHDAGTLLSQPEIRDLVAAVALTSYVIPSATKNSAVSENANIAHATAHFRDRGDDRGPVL